jgi:PTS system galactitol-specific IIA component
VYKRQAGEAISFLSRSLYQAGYVKDTFEEAVLKREEEYPTGLPTVGYGVAIPHTDAEHVLKPTIAVGVLKKPVVFKEMGYPDSTVNVSLVCVLALEKSGYVDLLSKFVEAIQDRDFLNRVCTEKDRSKIAMLLNAKLSAVQKEEVK